MRVAAAVIWREGRLLLCQRPKHKRHGGLWEFPGGKLAPEESVRMAIRRELAEELALQADHVAETSVAIADTGSEFVIEFVDVEASGTPEPREHIETAWVLPEDAVSYPLAPADRQFVVEHLLEDR